jgi:hypothetical protein
MTEMFPGMVTDMSETSISTGCAEVAVAFGRGVVTGASADKVKIPTASGDRFRGIAKHTHKEIVNGLARYEATEAVPVLKRGTICVEVNEAVTVDAPAYLVATGTDAGKFCDTATNNIATGGVFRTATTGAGLAKLEINLP